MKFSQYIKKYMKHYQLQDMLLYSRCAGRNLFYKKVLIYILRVRFSLTFDKIADVFNNNHSTIMYHFNDIMYNQELDSTVKDAMKLYEEGEE